jgi:predicted cupin superfamily sugar epimerase
VPPHAWQAAESNGDWTLVGCTVAPGFEFEDFTFLRDDASGCRALRNVAPELSLLL